MDQLCLSKAEADSLECSLPRTYRGLDGQKAQAAARGPGQKDTCEGLPDSSAKRVRRLVSQPQNDAVDGISAAVGVAVVRGEEHKARKANGAGSSKAERDDDL
ncbi:hypothetical protein O9K51_02208 [Purpureocillium lavendulum]|uniref:Uncharacterized protein n=1 Tax=Purpureocillium lavendulum TaxID=1247861 RepID=A0AB34FZG3_9HYPO|nr:hypothetical protein O9K51_02208 [Purpureocillium lavendulum]